MTLCTPYADLNDLAACECPDAPGTVAQSSLEVASEILYALTGRQYPGTCPAVLRPCASPDPMLGFNWLSWPYPWYPIRIGGVWLNMGPCGCHTASDCACSTYPRVNLGRDDVQTVTAVTIDGAVLDESDYRLDENRYLVKLSGAGPAASI